MILMSAPSMEGELKIMIKDTDKKKEAILKIVADNIEGGLQTIQGRLKRYEKDI